MLSSVVTWVFYSRRRLLLTVAGTVGLLLAVAVLNGTGGGASEPQTDTSSPSPTSTEPGAWLQEAPTPTTTTTAPIPTEPTETPLHVAGAFVQVFTDRSMPADAWRTKVGAHSTPELRAALDTADPSRVPVLTGYPKAHLNGSNDAQATVTVTYPEGALRLTLTTDGEAWLVANVVPVE